MNFDSVINHGQKSKHEKDGICTKNADVVLGFWIPNNYMSWNNS